MIIKHIAFCCALFLAGLLYSANVIAEAQGSVVSVSNRDMSLQSNVQTIACPSQLVVNSVSIHGVFSDYQVPQDWSSISTMTSGYVSVLLQPLLHQVDSGQLKCFYGLIGSGSTSYKFEGLVKPAPEGKTCVPEANYTFSCTN